MIFSIKCDLIGFIRIVLERPEFGLEKKPHIITQLLRTAIEFRRVKIFEILINYADSKKLFVYEECDNPLIFIYKRSYTCFTKHVGLHPHLEDDILRS